MQGILLTKGLIFGMDLPLPFIVFTHNGAQIKKEVPIIREYHNHTADQPTTM